MEQNIKSRLLESIGKVYESAKGCKLEPAFFDEVKPEIAVISLISDLKKQVKCIEII